jgi:flagellar motility protein MotE (MotC chaperone)
MASNGVRVLPALIAVSIGALAFKAADFAQAVAEAVDASEAAAAEIAEAPPPETALTAGAGTVGDPAQCLPSIDYAAEMGMSEQEVLVLRSLADRRKALDGREAEIVAREALAAAAEQRLDDQIVAIKALQQEANTVLAAMDTKRDERMAMLVKTYEAMKPKDAANIFNTMDDKVMLDLAKSMKPANLGTILAAMETKRAEKLTRMLADLSQPPTSIEALKQQAAGLPPAPAPAAAAPGGARPAAAQPASAQPVAPKPVSATPPAEAAPKPVAG